MDLRIVKIVKLLIFYNYLLNLNNNYNFTLVTYEILVEILRFEVFKNCQL